MTKKENSEREQKRENTGPTIQWLLKYASLINLIIIPIIVAFYYITQEQIDRNTQLFNSYMNSFNTFIEKTQKSLNEHNSSIQELTGKVNDNLKDINHNFKILRIALGEPSNKGKVSNLPILELMEDLQVIFVERIKEMNTLLADQSAKLDMFTGLFVAGIKSQYKSYNLNVDSIRLSIKNSKMDYPFWILDDTYYDSLRIYAIGLSNIYDNDELTFINANHMAQHNLSLGFFDYLEENEDRYQKIEDLESIYTRSKVSALLKEYFKYKDEYITKNQFYLRIILYRSDIPKIIARINEYNKELRIKNSKN